MKRHILKITLMLMSGLAITGCLETDNMTAGERAENKRIEELQRFCVAMGNVVDTDKFYECTAAAEAAALEGVNKIVSKRYGITYTGETRTKSD